MTSDNIKTEPNRRVFLRLPKKYLVDYFQKTPLDHGLFIKDLNPNINEGYLKAYFREYGTVTLCEKYPKSAKKRTCAFVRFSTEDEADRADWAGPHDIGGTEVIVKRVVCEKIEETSETETHAVPVKAAPRRSMGLGYILEDAQWLENE
ncbi:centromere protein X isoform X1 [Melanotaenia boesemani]|uniref:centromere protein X isoform X1 n=1 Tax=Melanotaenia boesemani TaxID=1250792 RepID=UPI001C05793D|nr:centromere protein X isoform X1 [Melanotaenia boesemani]